MSFNFCDIYKLININKRNTMENIRFRAWDTIEKCWFKPYYKRASVNTTDQVKELLLTQTGELMLREVIDGREKITHELNFEFKNRYIVNLRAGVKDRHGKKYFFNDIVCFTDKQGYKSYGVLVWYGDRFGIGSGPIDDYTAIDQVTEIELREAEIVGNIYQDRKIIMGTEPPIPEPTFEDRLKNKGLM